MCKATIICKQNYKTTFYYFTLPRCTQNVFVIIPKFVMAPQKHICIRLRWERKLKLKETKYLLFLRRVWSHSQLILILHWNETNWDGSASKKAFEVPPLLKFQLAFKSLLFCWDSTPSSRAAKREENQISQQTKSKLSLNRPQVQFSILHLCRLPPPGRK